MEVAQSSNVIDISQSQKYVLINDFEDVISRYSQMVYRIAFSYTGNRDDADDVYQEVFIKYSENNLKFTQEEHRKAWLIKVTINMCNSLHRSSWKKKTVLVTEQPEGEAISDEQEDYSQLHEAVSSLKKIYKEVIILFYFEEYSTEEIGKILGITQRTVCTRMTRARQMLSDKLVKMGGSYGRTKK